MEAIMPRVNVVLSSLIKGRRSRRSVTNVFGGETNDKTFNLHLIKALKEKERERVKIKKRCVCMYWISAWFGGDEKFLPLGFCMEPVFEDSL